MSPDRGSEPLSYRRIGRADLGDIDQLQLDPDQVERYLGPVPEILAAVRRGPAHSLVGVEATGRLVGFFVLNPDPRDASCWWLGWFAMDRRVQGRGYGSEAMREIMRRLRCVGCRRARLLVVPGNPAAILYERMGFRTVGEDASEGSRHGGRAPCRILGGFRGAGNVDGADGLVAPRPPPDAAPPVSRPARSNGDRRRARASLPRLRSAASPQYKIGQHASAFLTFGQYSI
jgi:GNAT superfamily N-acetyltransferase